MTTLSSPGVQVNEIDLSTTVQAATVSPGAFVGVFQWGPVGQPTLTDGEDVLKDQFFKPTNFNAETWFTAASFLAYTNNLQIVRAADTTGNTAAVSFTGNSTNLAGVAGNNVLQLANTSTLAAGMVFLYADTQAGVPLGAHIASVNSTAVVLDQSFSANVQSIVAMFRDDVSYTAAALQSDLNYTPISVSDWDSLVVENENDYEHKVENFYPGALYVARYPGAPGNSLRVAVCDSYTQFKSNTAITGNAQISSTVSGLFGTTGSNVLSLVVSPNQVSNSTHLATANALMTSLKASLSVGDLIEVGNTRIGQQFLKITAIGNVVTASNVYSLSINVSDQFKLAANTTNPYISRFWEFYREFEIAPDQSNYQLAHGNNAANDEMHVVVIDEGGMFSGSPGAILETYPNVSRATDAKSEDNASTYYKNVINTKSKYIWWGNDRTTAVSNTAAFLTSSTATVPLSMRMVGGSSGLDEANVPLATLAFGWDLFKSSEDINVSLLMQGKARGEPISAKTQLANYIFDNVAAQRNPKDAIVFASPDIDDVVNNRGSEVEDVVAFANNLRDSSYIVMDSGYKYMYDKYNDVNRWVPLNGDIAGLCARTDKTNDPWWSPAGLNRGQILNVTRLAWNPRQAQRDALYNASVNPVISTPGLGTYLYGDKTMLGHQSAFDRINVRRLFIVLEKSIANAAKFSLFEFNDDFTRAQFRNLVTPYLRNVKGRRGIYDFRVVCDSTNNTGEVIDNNRFVASIFIKPARSINYIELNFVATRTDVSFETVAGFGA